MKGQSEVTEAVFTIAMIAATFYIIIYILPLLTSDVANMLSLASAEVVARDIGGLTTISSAAPGSITITYQPLIEDSSYNVKMKDRIVEIEMMRGEKKCTTNICEGQAVTLVDTTEDFNEVNTFTITKSRETGYNVDAS